MERRSTASPSAVATCCTKMSACHRSRAQPMGAPPPSARTSPRHSAEPKCGSRGRPAPPRPSRGRPPPRSPAPTGARGFLNALRKELHHDDRTSSPPRPSRVARRARLRRPIAWHIDVLYLRRHLVVQAREVLEKYPDKHEARRDLVRRHRHRQEFARPPELPGASAPGGTGDHNLACSHRGLGRARWLLGVVWWHVARRGLRWG